MKTLFFDLDGVLCDFVGGALKLHGVSLDPQNVTWGFPEKIGFAGVNDPNFWNPLTRPFWAGLDPCEDGMELLNQAIALVGVEKIGLLTSPCDTEGCVEGKRDWVAKHLPDFKRRLFVGSAKELFASPTKILIDDHSPNCEKFILAGGKALTPPRPWNHRKNESCERGLFDAKELGWELAERIFGTGA